MNIETLLNDVRELLHTGEFPDPVKAAMVSDRLGELSDAIVLGIRGWKSFEMVEAIKRFEGTSVIGNAIVKELKNMKTKMEVFE